MSERHTNDHGGLARNAWRGARNKHARAEPSIRRNAGGSSVRYADQNKHAREAERPYPNSRPVRSSERAYLPGGSTVPPTPARALSAPKGRGGVKSPPLGSNPTCSNALDAELHTTP